jgi:site-specific DNA-methyltransferase (adenine-specific)
MIINGNCLEELDKLDENSVDAIVTDPPYELNFMGKGWDNAGVSFNKETWQKCLRVLKPGGYLLAFGGTRTYHRIACAIEDAGFEIRDCVLWVYGSGFPKSMNIGLAVDKKLGNESKVTGIRKQSGAKFKLTQELIDNGGFNDPDRKEFEVKEAQNEWKGWGTALKPSYEPIIVARKPFKGSLVDNVMKYGVGGLNIDECRVGNEERTQFSGRSQSKTTVYNSYNQDNAHYETVQGRFPANTILTYGEADYDEVCGGFPQTKGTKTNSKLLDISGNNYNNSHKTLDISYERGYDDSGSAARYFYCAKASKKDRDEGLEEFEKDITDDGRNKPIDNPYLRGKTMRHNTHPTVKPTSLMQYLIRLVAPKGATILDPFMGSGSTGKAVMYENKERNAGYKFIGIEKDAEYCKIAEARIKNAELFNGKVD